MVCIKLFGGNSFMMVRHCVGCCKACLECPSPVLRCTVWLQHSHCTALSPSGRLEADFTEHVVSVWRLVGCYPGPTAASEIPKWRHSSSVPVAGWRLSHPLNAIMVCTLGRKVEEWLFGCEQPLSSVPGCSLWVCIWVRVSGK